MRVRSLRPSCLFNALITAIALSNTGCATSTPIPDGTVMLREVAHVLSRQEIVSGEVRATFDNRGREPIRVPDLHELLLKNGMQDRDMVDGSVVLGRTQYFWHNVTSGVVRQYVQASIVAKGLEVHVGNIVEVEKRGNFATVIRVKYTNPAEGRCEYRTNDRNVVSSALAAINPVGAGGGASLYCPYLAEEGWTPNQHLGGVEWTKQSLKKQ